MWVEFETIGLLLIHSFFFPLSITQISACYNAEALVSDTAQYSFIDVQHVVTTSSPETVVADSAIINAVMNIVIGQMGTYKRLKPSGSVFQV